MGVQPLPLSMMPKHELRYIICVVNVCIVISAKVQVL